MSSSTFYFCCKARTITYYYLSASQAWWKCLSASFAPARPQLRTPSVTTSLFTTCSKRVSFHNPTRYDPASRGPFLLRPWAPKISSSASSSANTPTVATDPTLTLTATNPPSTQTWLGARRTKSRSLRVEGSMTSK